MTRVAIPSLMILHVQCQQCRSRYFAVIDGPLPSCLVYRAQRWRIIGVWDLRTQAWPPTLPRVRSKEPA